MSFTSLSLNTLLIWSARGLHTWLTTAVPNCHNETRVFFVILSIIVLLLSSNRVLVLLIRDKITEFKALRFVSRAAADECHREQFLISSQDSSEGESRCVRSRDLCI